MCELFEIKFNFKDKILHLMCCREHFISYTNKLKYFILLLEFFTFLNKIARDFFYSIYDFTFFLYPQSRRFIIVVLISLVITVWCDFLYILIIVTITKYPRNFYKEVDIDQLERVCEMHYRTALKNWFWSSDLNEFPAINYCSCQLWIIHRRSTEDDN